MQKRDEKIVKAVEELKKTEMKSLKDEKQKIENGVVIKEGIYVLERKLRGEVVRLHHDTPVGEHRERQKTTEIVTRNYWWPGVTKEVGRYVKGYNAC